METSLVSIITPVYNTEKYLAKCIESILKQDYKNIELILVDDGSTDNSGKICDEYAAKDKRVFVIHKENAGQGIARNAALDIARGQYIGFVDSDDYIMPNMFSAMVDALQKESADMAVCGVINDHVFTKKECPKQECKKVYSKEELFISYLREPYIRGIICNKLFKAELFEEMRFSSIRAREDAALLYKIYGKCEKTVYIPESLYIQYIRPGSTEQSAYSESKLYTIQIFEDMAEYIRINIPEIANYTELLRARAIYDAMNGMMSSKNYREWTETFAKLLEDLKAELETHREHDPVNDALYIKFSNAAQNPNELIKKARVSRIKNSGILAVKKIFTLLRGC